MTPAGQGRRAGLVGIDDRLRGEPGQPDHVVIGQHLGRLKRLYGDRTTLLGNMDCGNLLSFGTPDEVARATVECIDAGWGEGGHILTASNAITASVPVANYLAMVNAYRGRFGMKRLEL